jgi:hypothetical protein
MDRAIMEELTKTGAITDLVVVALLRVNAIGTKESLGKALFNLLARGEFRAQMIELNVLSAILQLARIESTEMLEMCTRCLFNVTCQTNLFAAKLGGLGVPAFLVSRSISHKGKSTKRDHHHLGSGGGGVGGGGGSSSVHGGSGSAGAGAGAGANVIEQDETAEDAALQSDRSSDMMLPGVKSSSTVKLLCGMSLANISFDQGLAKALTYEKVADAAITIFKLNSDQATYCSMVVLYNISFLSDCTSLIDCREMIPTIVEVLTRGPVLCTQLATACLTNFSIFPVFHEVLNMQAMGAVINLMASPQMDFAIKVDALRFVYTMVTSYEPSKAEAARQNCTDTIWKMIKVQESEEVLLPIGRIVKELCVCASADAVIHRRLMTDGIMKIVLKLAKMEIPHLKYDMSVAIHALTMAGETNKVLKWDGLDILFWLTLHDCLNLYDPIRRNVGRALRNFSATEVEGLILVQEDRFMPVLKSLAKSLNEDVLLQASAVLYELMGFPECKKILLGKGVIGLIFEIATSGFTAVRHVCSACLHMAPEDLPDMGDPAVLDLVLCLLEAEGERFGELGEKAMHLLPYMLPTKQQGTPFKHAGTEFAPTWLSLTADIEALWTPALIPMPASPSLPPSALKAIKSTVASTAAVTALSDGSSGGGGNTNSGNGGVQANSSSSTPPETQSFSDRVEAPFKAPAADYDDFKDQITIDQNKHNQSQSQSQEGAKKSRHASTSSSTSMLGSSGGVRGTQASGWNTFASTPPPRKRSDGTVNMNASPALAAAAAASASAAVAAVTLAGNNNNNNSNSMNNNSRPQNAGYGSNSRRGSEIQLNALVGLPSPHPQAPAPPYSANGPGNSTVSSLGASSSSPSRAHSISGTGNYFNFNSSTAASSNASMSAKASGASASASRGGAGFNTGGLDFPSPSSTANYAAATAGDAVDSSRANSQRQLLTSSGGNGNGSSRNDGEARTSAGGNGSGDDEYKGIQPIHASQVLYKI